MTSLYDEVQTPTDGVPTRRVTMTVNGEKRTVDVEPRLLLAHLLRQGMQLTGTHVGCDTTSCGACTVLFDGRPVKSCTMLAVQADGHDVETVEYFFAHTVAPAFVAAALVLLPALWLYRRTLRRKEGDQPPE